MFRVNKVKPLTSHRFEIKTRFLLSSVKLYYFISVVITVVPCCELSFQ